MKLLNNGNSVVNAGGGINLKELVVEFKISTRQLEQGLIKTHEGTGLIGLTGGAVSAVVSPGVSDEDASSIALACIENRRVQLLFAEGAKKPFMEAWGPIQKGIDGGKRLLRFRLHNVKFDLVSGILTITLPKEVDDIEAFFVTNGHVGRTAGTIMQNLDTQASIVGAVSARMARKVQYAANTPDDTAAQAALRAVEVLESTGGIESLQKKVGDLMSKYQF